MEAAPLGLEAGELFFEGAYLGFEHPALGGGLDQAVALAEAGQFTLQLGGACFQGRGLLVEEADAIGQALLALVEGRLQVGLAELIQQALVLLGIAAGDCHREHPFGFLLAATASGDADPVAEGRAGEAEAAGDWLQHDRALEHLDQGWDVGAGGVAGQLGKHGVVEGCGAAGTALVVVADRIADQELEAPFIHGAK